MAAQTKLFVWQQESAVIIHLIFEMFNKNDKVNAIHFLNIGIYRTLSTTHYQFILTVHKYTSNQDGLEAYQPFSLTSINYGSSSIL